MTHIPQRLGSEDPQQRRKAWLVGNMAEQVR